jgi:ATP-dependent Zn protease
LHPFHFFCFKTTDLWILSDGVRKVLEKNKEITEKYDNMENYMLDILIRYRSQLINEELKKIETKKTQKTEEKQQEQEKEKQQEMDKEKQKEEEQKEEQKKVFFFFYFPIFFSFIDFYFLIPFFFSFFSKQIVQTNW